MVSVRVYVLGTVAALAVGLIYVYRRLTNRRQSPSIKARIVRPASASEPKTKESVYLAPGQVSPAEIEQLVSLLASANTTKFTKIMKTLIQYSNDNVNLPSFRRPKTLSGLTSQIMLGGDGGFLRTVNVYVLNLFANLMVDDVIRDHIKTEIDCFFYAPLNTLDEEELVATLRLLANLAIVEDGCPCLWPHLTDIYKVLDLENQLVQRQVWTFLLNISCDASSLPQLLKAVVYGTTDEAIVNVLLTHSDDEVVLGKALRFLYTMYKELKKQTSSRYSFGSMGTTLLDIKSKVNAQVLALMLSSPDSDSLFELKERLSELLQQ